MSQQSSIAQIEQNPQIQEMHPQKPKCSRPKTTQNFVSPTDRNLSPCTKLLQAKKAKNHNFKPVFLSDIFARALKEDQGKQTEAEVSNTELSKDI